MKRVPEVSRASFRRITPSFPITALHSPVCVPRYFHSHPIPRRFSLADHIKQFIPPEAVAPEVVPPEPEDQTNVQERSDMQYGSLAEYSTEVFECLRLVDALEFHKACQILTQRLPFESVLTAVVDKLAPRICEGALGELGVVELVYTLYKQGNEPLVAHILHDLQLDLDVSLFYFVSQLPEILTTDNLDCLLTMWDSSLHFPQLLNKPELPMWFKVHMLSRLGPKCLAKWLKRYSTVFRSADLAMLISLVPRSHLSVIQQHLAGATHLNLDQVLAVVNTREMFQCICRPFIRSSSCGSEWGAPLLVSAIRLRLSYDIASICSKWAIELQAEKYFTLLADALLAAAFAQRKPPQNQDIDQTVFGPPTQFHTFMVSKVLEPVIDDEDACNTVLGIAASRLRYQYPKKVPGNVFWRLVLSLPPTLDIRGLAQRSLARLVVQRPYVEQLRYMALPTITARGVGEVLKWHITKVMDYRQVNVVRQQTPQAEEDVQFLVTGIILASEKTTYTNDSVGKLVSDLFENWSESQALAMMGAVSSQTYREISRRAAFHVIAKLIEHKSFVVAFQLLQALGPNKVSSYTLDSLLQSLASEHPEETYQFVLWLVEDHGTRVSSQTINRMLTTISQSALLSESQLMNRFQSLRQLMWKGMRQQVEPKPAIELVNAFLRSAYERKGGSRMRLKWAFDVAHHAGVPEQQFTEWAEILDEMQKNKQAYWYQ